MSEQKLNDEFNVLSNEEIEKCSDIQSALELINKENIITLAMEKAENYKGGRQKSLIVKFEDDGESYRIIGNTPSHEMADFYARVVSEVTNIIR